MSVNKPIDQESTKEFQLGPIDLSIKQGSLTAILGRSGSGKTTLLSIIGLLRKHQKGSVKIHSKKENRLIELKRLWDDNEQLDFFRSTNLGFALQKGELLPHLTMYENASLVSAYLGREASKMDQKVKGFFEELFKQEAENENSLTRIMNQKPSSVSQGQYQRGAIVRALANDPSIVLADEPTGNLDIHAGAKTMQIFRTVIEKDKEKSVIVVTHDRKLAVDYADEIIILKEGKVNSIFKKDATSVSWTRKDDSESEKIITDTKTLMDKIGIDLD